MLSINSRNEAERGHASHIYTYDASAWRATLLVVTRTPPAVSEPEAEALWPEWASAFHDMVVSSFPSMSPPCTHTHLTPSQLPRHIESLCQC
jgi:hypothetical protein